MFSTTVNFSSHWDMRGLAAARMEVRALREQMMPALAMERVCCSWSEREREREGGRERGRERVRVSVCGVCVCVCVCVCV